MRVDGRDLTAEFVEDASEAAELTADHERLRPSLEFQRREETSPSV
jgi:hypothetical protein